MTQVTFILFTGSAPAQGPSAIVVSAPWRETFYSPTNYDSTFFLPAESLEMSRASCFFSYSNVGVSDDEITQSLNESYKVILVFLFLSAFASLCALPLPTQYHPAQWYCIAAATGPHTHIQTIAITALKMSNTKVSMCRVLSLSLCRPPQRQGGATWWP